jgi:putative glutamine amidotransferase
MADRGTTQPGRAGYALLALIAGLGLAAFALVYFPAPAADAPSALVSVDRTLWNRLGFNRLTHTRALRDAGLRPVIVDFGSDTAVADELFDGVDALIIAGGGDVDPSLYGSDFDAALDVKPERDRFELALLEAAERRGLPVLGLCRGAQLINVHRGGTLGDFRAESERFDRHHRLISGHPVNIATGSRLASIYGATRLDEIVTFHGQYVAEPGDGVRITAFAPDGTPEAIEVVTESGFGVIGVQWHAEVWPWDEDQARLFRAFAEAASAYRDSRLAYPN